MPQDSSKSAARTIFKAYDWNFITKTVLRSRIIDETEEEQLTPSNETPYQFSAKGHELGQILLASLLTHEHDASSAYYRSRPLMLALGLSNTDAIASQMGKAGGYSDGRDIGVVCNMTREEGRTVLPMAGDVGSQYSPAAGWAQSIKYRKEVLAEEEYEEAISLVLGGDGSVATNGFWSALNMATTLDLPLLFYIEDNQYGLSVPAEFQTPGGNIADNLESYKNLNVFDGDGTDPEQAASMCKDAVDYVRNGNGPVLLRLVVPRLCGHAYHDNQAYKEQKTIEEEKQNDPLNKLEQFVLQNSLIEREWSDLKKEVEKNVQEAVQRARQRAEPDPDQVKKFAFEERKNGSPEIQVQGGLAPEGHTFPSAAETPQSGGKRLNIVEAIRRTLDHELSTNDKLVVFGEDVGKKGGVHAVTMGLQSTHGSQRVFDTSLSEDGIVGRAVGMAYAGLMPVAEIQFRKYADPATEQIHNCGTIRWRTANKFAAPMVIRMPGGFAKVGDPWHSLSNEADFLHAVGWQLAYPSNAEDAVGLLRMAMRSNNPTIFFEHRNLLDAKYARRPYPGDQYIVPFGKARKLQEGEELTVVTWGAMTERCEEAARKAGVSADILDLRTLMPWDEEAVIASLKKTNRCMVVHEDVKTAGFGAEINAVLAQKCFTLLDAPPERVTMSDIPVPFNPALMESVMPTTEKIAERMRSVARF